MNKLNVQIKCPKCKAEGEPIADGFQDGTITEICSECYTSFSYRVIDGEIAPWMPPAGTHQSWGGKGEAGGE